MKKYFLTLLSVIVAIGTLLSFSPVYAGFSEGVSAYQEGNYAKAFNEFKSLAEQGYAPAQYNLGLMYADGIGVAQDDKQAVAWYRKAAEQGYAPAQYNTGWMYYKGQGVAQDYKQAVVWYRKAAEQGYAPAQYNLGLMYFKGHGVVQDLVLSYMWLNLAEADGDKKATELRSSLDKYMPLEQISQAQALARDWLKRHRQL